MDDRTAMAHLAGMTYNGTWRNGVPFGLGLVRLAGDVVCRGEWVHGKLEGQRVVLVRRNKAKFCTRAV
jgi:hypothetical protein